MAIKRFVVQQIAHGVEDAAIEHGDAGANQLSAKRLRQMTFTSTFVMHLLDGDMRALSELELFEVVDRLLRLWK